MAFPLEWGAPGYLERKGDEDHLGLLGLENKDGWSDHMLGNRVRSY